MSKSAPKNVVLVGRINVGKSSLFNRLTGRKHALVSAEPGTTRDRRIAETEWNNTTLHLIDTGGVEYSTTSDQWQPKITKQTEQALKESDLVLLVVSAKDGVLPQDKAWAKKLRGKYPTLLVVNKVDTAKLDMAVFDFHVLGLSEPLPVSATTGRQTGDLLDAITNKLAELPKRRRSRRAVSLSNETALRLSILGQPNAGKSSLINALLGEERVIADQTAHTTREAHDIPFAYKNHDLLIVDTPGIRRSKQKRGSLEAESVEVSLQHAERADVVLLVVDAERGPTVQDQRLASKIAEQGNGLILVINKWDLIEDKDAGTIKSYEKKFRDLLPGLNWVPMIFISATTKLRARLVLDTAIEVAKNRLLEIPSDKLNDFYKTATRKHRPSKGGGVKHPTVLGFEQIGTKPPYFEMTVQGELHPSYLRFLENQLREHFSLSGTPVNIKTKEIKKIHGKGGKDLERTRR
jgi:GTP-binding protein